MNRKKEIEKKFFGSGKGGPLTEQVSWDLIHTIVVELFTADLLKKKSKFYHLSVQRYLQNKRDFFENLIFEKTCFAFLSEDGFDDASPPAFEQSSL